eukprot:TRINITY_DN65073_c0_g1_i1.p1 TRINITY_DN65073_c0_g1~~TRINITY_DN65073_c0_g1_i1.p1  ORF type:complete len:443 (+),score=114.47 TRINITY_DN65073_c0_g1_i1:99-1427(+)
MFQGIEADVFRDGFSHPPLQLSSAPAGRPTGFPPEVAPPLPSGWAATVAACEAAQTAAYGEELRAWLALQVDERLQQLCVSSLLAELRSMRQDVAVARSSTSRLETDFGLSASAQKRLVSVVQGLSEEVAALKSSQERWAAAEAELRRGLDDLASRLESSAETRAVSSRLSAEVEADLFERLHERLTRDKDSEDRRLERRLQRLHRDVVEVESLRDDVESRIQRHAAELRNQMQTEFEAHRMSLQALHEKVQQKHGSANEVAELRAEVTAAFTSESAAIAALDEQLWLCDQRLGERIDDLVHRLSGPQEPPEPQQRNVGTTALLGQQGLESGEAASAWAALASAAAVVGKRPEPDAAAAAPREESVLERRSGLQGRPAGSASAGPPRSPVAQGLPKARAKSTGTLRSSKTSAAPPPTMSVGPGYQPPRPPRQLSAEARKRFF